MLIEVILLFMLTQFLLETVTNCLIKLVLTSRAKIYYMNHPLPIDKYFQSLNEDELSDIFFNYALQAYIQAFGVKGVVEELVLYCETMFKDPLPEETMEQQKSWERDYKKLKKLKLEN
ncbi:hypothetical protein Chro_3156 [Chroococcidiopsis thermalis PCC 7203]|uniref:Uncharacterized protein n=2 Tax=Chroococcidiopsis thermalis TaxID=54299 RepID=K9U0K3_CHRTP|nr:hypothetical protein Chro_3156 [Chroococcidiopsis thermalis PCC 7203]